MNLDIHVQHAILYDLLRRRKQYFGYNQLSTSFFYTVVRLAIKNYSIVSLHKYLSTIATKTSCHNYMGNMPSIRTVAGIVIINDSENHFLNNDFACKSGRVDEIKNKVCCCCSSSTYIVLKTVFPQYNDLTIEIHMRIKFSRIHTLQKTE